jgi:hypothetical protein
VEIPEGNGTGFVWDKSGNVVRDLQRSIQK